MGASPLNKKSKEKDKITQKRRNSRKVDAHKYFNAFKRDQV